MGKPDITYQEAVRTGHIPVIDATEGLDKVDAWEKCRQVIRALRGIGEKCRIKEGSMRYEIEIIRKDPFRKDPDTGESAERILRLKPVEYRACTDDPPPSGVHVNFISRDGNAGTAISRGSMTGEFLSVHQGRGDVLAVHWQSLDGEYASKKHPDFFALGESLQGRLKERR